MKDSEVWREVASQLEEHGREVAAVNSRPFAYVCDALYDILGESWAHEFDPDDPYRYERMRDEMYSKFVLDPHWKSGGVIWGWYGDMLKKASFKDDRRRQYAALGERIIGALLMAHICEDREEEQ